jgi:perosamine synthetase
MHAKLEPACQRVSGAPAIPVYGPALGEEEAANLAECVRSHQLIHGPFVTRFEQSIAAYVGHAHGVGTNSGTAALHVALRLAGVQAGDEVLINTLTFIAPANAIAYLGAHPVFIDAEPETWQLDPAKLRAFVERDCTWDGERLVNRATGRRVTAIVLVHFLGMPADLDAVCSLAARYRLKLIEDAAQALGTEYRGRRCGGFAPIGCFSFYGNKLITAGGGGMIVTSDAELAAKARYLVNQAKDDPIETVHHEIGYNYRMTNLHGAIGCAQFERIDAHISAKRRIAQRYREGLGQVDGLALVDEPPHAFFTFWLSSIRIDPVRFGMNAREVLAALALLGIETIPLYQPLHHSRAHSGAQHVGGEVAERLVSEGLSLPSSVNLARGDQERVIDAIRALVARRAPAALRAGVA